MKKFGMLVLLIACLMLFSGIAAASSTSNADGGDDDGCEKSPGYWKNHPDAWPVDEIEIGGITYTKDDAIELMDTPVKGDKTYTLFRALVAAKLNILNGCENCEIESTIVIADDWMGRHNIGVGLKASSISWQDCGDGEYLYEILDQYNNGMFD